MMKVRVTDKESRFLALMDSSNSNTPSFLDKVRLENGADEYRKYFRNLAKYNKRKSIQLINDENLSFSSLFTLRSEIYKYNLSPYLNMRNRNALKIVDTVLSRESSINTRSTPHYKQMSYSELRWIFETGHKDDGLANEYDEVLDTTAILLTRVHKDKTFMNDILEMIFTRHKKGLYINDLVWAFFEARDPQCLVMIANRLNSSDESDVELARNLLGFIPCIRMGRNADKTSQYTCTMTWIQENYLFLYYTGESYQQSNSPIPYSVSPEGRYLFKPVSVETGRVSNVLNVNEELILKNFRKMDEKSKLVLSNYSFMLHRQNIYSWSTWLNYPVAEQLRIAETMIGGLP